MRFHLNQFIHGNHARLILRLGFLVLSVIPALGETVRLEFLARYAMKPGGAEIIDYAAKDQVLVSTRSHHRHGRGVEVIDLADPAKPELLRRIDFDASVWPEKVRGFDVSSVTVDPRRGFGAAALIPEPSNQQTGRVVFFDYRSGETLAVLPTGYHPDSVLFSTEGRFLLVADEGEYQRRGPQVPGSLTVIDLSGIGEASDLAKLSAEAAQTYPFTAVLGATDAMLDGIRNHHGPGSDIRIALEPEYVAESEGRVYVSLQENNALAVFDLDARSWLAIHDLGTFEVEIDPSDRDGAFGAPSARVRHPVAGLPMPDTIEAVDYQSRTLILTANEGDARPDAADRMRLKHAGVGGPRLHPELRAELKTQLGADPLGDPYLGRLQVSKLDGLDADGHIVRPTMFGTRSFSIVDGATGQRIFDSGSFFERYPMLRDPRRFNMNRGTERRRDTRSDNKGPEIEAITATVYRDALWIAVGAERQNGIFLFRAEDPAEPAFEAYVNLEPVGDFSPECIQLIAPEKRADDRFLMAVAYEGSQTIAIFEILE